MKIEECEVIKRATELGLGIPEQNDGKCEGYASDENELPIMSCCACEHCTMNLTFSGGIRI